MTNHDSTPLTRNTGLFAGALLAVTVSLAASGCEAVDDGAIDPAGVDAEVSAQLEDLAVRTQVLEDREAIRSALACYGRGHDEIFNHLQADQSPAIAILRDCHTDDVATDVFFFDSPEPTAQLGSLAELVGFIEQFAIDSSYTGARNVVCDIGIEFTGPDTARVVSATSTPHFIQPANTPNGEPTVDLVSARYIDEMVRGSDGLWRSARKSLLLDQFWRGTGFYPFAQ